MDPDETVRELRELAAQTTHGLDSEALSVIACQQAELWNALDQWLTRGGFPPRDWTG